MKAPKTEPTEKQKETTQLAIGAIAILTCAGWFIYSSTGPHTCTAARREHQEATEWYQGDNFPSSSFGVSARNGAFIEMEKAEMKIAKLCS